jgi:hypothetical protein
MPPAAGGEWYSDDLFYECTFWEKCADEMKILARIVVGSCCTGQGGVSKESRSRGLLSR